MKLKPQTLSGLFLVVPEPIEDERGFFARSFSKAAFESAGLVSEFAEWSLSYNSRMGTLRGLHLQAAPFAESKLVQCIRGAVFDVAVDLRAHSPSFGRWHAVTLSAENRCSFYIPAGFAHGFQTLAADSELLYHISEPYRPGHDLGVRWDDPDLAIAWPSVSERTMSQRDRSLPRLRDLPACYGKGLVCR